MTRTQALRMAKANKARKARKLSDFEGGILTFFWGMVTLALVRFVLVGAR